MKTDLPSIDNNGTEQQIKAEWDMSAELRAEFGDSFEAFAAFCKHRDNIRIMERRVTE
jgi:hypothetical protein